MVITEIRVKLEKCNEERLLAFCSITIDDAFVIRDLKIIEGDRNIFVGMPSRKLTDRCRNCGCKNHLRACFCNKCGKQLGEDRAMRDANGHLKLHADIAHPINQDAREIIQRAVRHAYWKEVHLSRQPGYICRYDDYTQFQVNGVLSKAQ
ncbi:MAG: hypothetical protein A3F47_00770 [Candidatus Staskawiczbacteria bacterium RIFCSPHIGHO2_12_FULL_38_11]|uniref:Stage V sporulation protein G n=1 Tax=Candidatus Staskawiczbacteria bacterium RIFCSPHIGHO2_12_FULL_38_11 TaxID=1802209 RepID=A0A1G2I6F7_9BACT|nr:MAG: hypothetical protein A3F47_00770 [Candidatus Staskawiczbacteria bacterium RIFCSPHIGHO2_12_FULL_38_11]